MKFDLTVPCGNCPFRNDGKGIVLSGKRAEEIASGMTNQQGTFSCHKTVEYGDEDGDGVEGQDTQHCGGALIMLEHMEQPNQMMRIAERIGMYDRTKLDMDAPVFEDAGDFVDHHESADW